MHPARPCSVPVAKLKAFVFLFLASEHEMRCLAVDVHSAGFSKYSKLYLQLTRGLSRESVVVDPQAW